LSTLGIVVAASVEARSLLNQSIARDELIRFPDGALLTVSGIGRERAARASKTLLERGATALLSWGSAGGLAPNLLPGALILPLTVIGSNRSLYHVDATLHARVCDRLRGLVAFHTDPLMESSTVVCTSAEKAILFRETGAGAVDMESAAVAAVAQEQGVPFMVVRAVADAMDTTIPESILNAFDEFGRVSFFNLIQGLVRHPTDLFALFRLGRNYRAAQRTLATVARLTRNSW
jgi:adenosylhomocysteine nucleosidase